MKINRNLPADDILQYEAERNARLLYNEVHLDATNGYPWPLTKMS